MRRIKRATPQSPITGDRGFTLVELIVAMMVIGVVLLALVGLQTSALVTITHAKQREQATAVANRVLEELRAMPWTTLSKGMNSVYFATGTDPNVSGGYLQASAQPAIHEVLKFNGQGFGVAPLSGTLGTNVTDIQDPAAPGITFKARTYVTTPPLTTLSVGAAPILQLTVIVTWTEVSGGHQQSIIARTEAYSPTGGCGHSETQPFLGACEAQLSAEAAALPATIGVIGADPTGAGNPALPVLPGSGVFSASISLGSTSATTSSQQATTTVATTTYPGAVTASASAALSATGGTSTRAGASSDIGAANVDPPDSGPTPGTGSSSQVTVTGTGGSTLTLTPSANGVNGSVTAATTRGCTGVAGANQPCSNATASVGAAPAILGFTAGGTPFQLASVAAAPSENAWSGRYSTPNSSGPGCMSVSGAGCVAAGAARNPFAATIGPNPPANTSGLVQVTGYFDWVRGELGAAQPSGSYVVSRSATLTWWTGSSYTSTTIDKATFLDRNGDTTYTASMPPGLLTMSWTTADGSTTVTAVGSLKVRPTVYTWVGLDPQCVTTACRLTVSQPSVTVSVLYHVVNASAGVDYSFIVTTDLGSVRSAVEYKAAPHV